MEQNYSQIEKGDISYNIWVKKLPPVPIWTKILCHIGSQGLWISPNVTLNILIPLQSMVLKIFTSKPDV